MDNQQILMKKPSNNKLVLLQLSAQRTTSGVAISAQSDVFERYFSQFTQCKRPQQYGINDYCYNMPSFSQRRYNNMFAELGSNLLIYGDSPNLAFLRYVGLKNGIQYTFENVYTKSEVNRYMKLSKIASLEFFNEIIKPLYYNYKIQFKTEDNLDF